MNKYSSITCKRKLLLGHLAGQVADARLTSLFSTKIYAKDVPEKLSNLEDFIIRDKEFYEAGRTKYENPKTQIVHLLSLTKQFETPLVSLKYEPNFTQLGEKSKVFKCEVIVGQPISAEFTGYATRKKQAEAVAMMKLVTSLEIEINESRKKNIERRAPKADGRTFGVPPILNYPIPLPLDETVMGNITEALNKFYTEIQPRLDNLDVSFKNTDYRMMCAMTGSLNHRMAVPSAKNVSLLAHYKEHIADNEGAYPTNNHKDEILEAIEKHQVVLIQGETGCGKSTQIPQIILDDYIKKNCGAQCNIIVSQPKRIAARSLAQRVARERFTQFGDCVGYKMRLDSKHLRSYGGIMFYTAGSLREALRFNADLQGVSHVIIDEVHENSLDTDALMVALRQLLGRRSDLRLIMMSATVQQDTIAKYFDIPAEARLFIKGRTFPVKQYYIGDTVQQLGLPLKNSYPDLSKPDCTLIAKVVAAIDKQKAPGAILIFVPGMKEIKSISKMLSERDRGGRLVIKQAHSNISVSLINQIFDPCPAGQRKVVIATNIAEHSITIPDVVYVIDCGLENNFAFQTEATNYIFSSEPISKANAAQRAGRAGRTREGEIYRLYTKDFHDQMADFPVPQILKIPLENLILRLLATKGEMSIEEYLQQLPMPPDPVCVAMAMEKLLSLGLLQHNEAGEAEQSILGHFCNRLSTEGEVAKALLYGAFLGCVPTLLDSFVTNARSMFVEPLSNSEMMSLKSQLSQTSDHVADSQLIKVFRNEQDEWNICPQHADTAKRTKTLLLNQLKQMFPPTFYDVFGDLTLEQRSATYQEKHLLACLAAGTTHMLKKPPNTRTKSYSKLYTKDQQVAKPETRSIFETAPALRENHTELLAAKSVMRFKDSALLVASSLSYICPVTAALFCGPELTSYHYTNRGVIGIEQMDIKFLTDGRSAETLMQLRKTFQTCLEHILWLNLPEAHDSQLEDELLLEDVVTLTKTLVTHISTLLQRDQMESQDQIEYDG